MAEGSLKSTKMTDGIVDADADFGVVYVLSTRCVILQGVVDDEREKERLHPGALKYLTREWPIGGGESENLLTTLK